MQRKINLQGGGCVKPLVPTSLSGGDQLLSSMKFQIMLLKLSKGIYSVFIYRFTAECVNHCLGIFTVSKGIPRVKDHMEREKSL